MQTLIAICLVLKMQSLLSITVNNSFVESNILSDCQWDYISSFIRFGDVIVNVNDISAETCKSMCLDDYKSKCSSVSFFNYDSENLFGTCVIKSDRTGDLIETYGLSGTYDYNCVDSDSVSEKDSQYTKYLSSNDAKGTKTLSESIYNDLTCRWEYLSNFVRFGEAMMMSYN